MSIAVLLAEGLDHHRAARYGPARACYLRLLAAAPDHADGVHLLGLAEHAAGAHVGAVGHLERAVALRPDVAHFRANLGTARLAAGDHAGAEACFRRVLETQPDNDDCWTNLGLALLRQGRADDAEPCFARALAVAPGRADAGPNLAACLHRRGDEAGAGGRADDAEACYRAALRVCPGHTASLTNLGNLLASRGRYDEAVTMLRRAVALDPVAADAHHNLAAALVAAGCLDEAEAASFAALLFDPGHADAHYTLGTAQLLAGRLPEGFAGLEYRWRRRGFASPREFAQPQWDGGALAGRTLLLHAEQGLGDAIQMLRFIPAIAAQARVLLEVPAPLRRLAKGLARHAEMFTSGEALPGFDLHCPLPSLPFALGLRLEGIPARVPYLRANAVDMAHWRDRLAGLEGLRVGLCWAGNPGYAADARRSIDPGRLAALADLPGIAFVSLQPGAQPPGLRLHDWTRDLRDLADTAALMAGLDLVVTVDTAVAHLAGALGRPVWLLNRFDTCWRWLLGRDDSPWYPTLRQFRQKRPGDWDGVLAAVRLEIAAYAREARKFSM